MCGGISNQRRQVTQDETKYLDALVRGVYLKSDIKAGTEINSKNFEDYFYLAIPLRKGQLSCREIFNGERLVNDVKKNQPLMISDVNGVLSESNALKSMILNRGQE